MQLMVMISRYLDFKCLIVLFLMKGGHGTQCQNLISEQHAPHPVRHGSPGTMKSYSVDITCLIGVSYRKAVGDVSMLEKRFNSEGMDLVILHFSFDSHTVLCSCNK